MKSFNTEDEEVDIEAWGWYNDDGYEWEGGQLLHAGTEHAEHIHIIITSAQEVDNMILNYVRRIPYR